MKKRLHVFLMITTIISILLYTNNQNLLNLKYAKAAISNNYYAIPREIIVEENAYNQNLTLKEAANELSNNLSRATSATIPIGNELDTETGSIIILNNDSFGLKKLLTYDEINRLNSMNEQGYMILPKKPNIIVASNTDEGILYGCYTLLEELGFRWITPKNTIIPTLKINSNYEWKTILQQPDFKYRGFWIYDNEPSIEFVKWAARNKFNLMGQINPKLAKTYQMNIWTGGHDLFYEFLNNDKLYSEKPELYGMRNGKRIPMNGNKTYYMNPNFSNPELAKEFYDFLIKKYNVNNYNKKLFINIWPSDINGTYYYCDCNECKKIGNVTDNLLFFYQNLTKELEKNQLTKFDIVINSISYNATWELPINLHNKFNSKYFKHILYLNERSFSNNVSQDPISSKIDNWSTYASDNFIDLGVVEYYNYSFYGGALSDYNDVIYDDIHYYKDHNISLFAYMHPLEGTNGTFDLLNYSLGKLLWNSQMTQESIEKVYFHSVYPELQDEISVIHKNINLALSNRKEILGKNSLSYCLFQEVFWSKPPYSTKQIEQNLYKYLNGGKQQLPSEFQNGDEYINANFIGLSQSITILNKNIERLKQLSEKDISIQTKTKIHNDIVWTEAACNIYRLLNNLTLLRIQSSTLDREEYLDLIKETGHIVRKLSDSEVFNKTISGVNQSTILNSIYDDRCIMPIKLRQELQKIKRLNQT